MNVLDWWKAHEKTLPLEDLIIIKPKNIVNYKVSDYQKIPADSFYHISSGGVRPICEELELYVFYDVCDTLLSDDDDDNTNPFYSKILKNCQRNSKNYQTL